MITFSSLKRAIKIISYSTVAFSMLLFAACTTIGKDYQAANQRDSIRNYEAFLNKHPNSKYEEWVNNRISELKVQRARQLELKAWEIAKKENTRVAYQNFLITFPQGDFSDKAKNAKNRVREELFLI